MKYLFVFTPWPQRAGTPQAQAQIKAEGECGRGTPGEPRAAEGARGSEPLGREGGKDYNSVRSASSRADEWETREPARRLPDAVPALSLAPRRFLTIVTMSKSCKLFAADPALVRL